MKKITKHIRTALILGTATLATGLLQAATDKSAAAPKTEQAPDPTALVKHMETVYEEMKEQLKSIHDRKTADAAAARLKDARKAQSAIGTSLDQIALGSALKKQALDIHGSIARLLSLHNSILEANDYYGSDELKTVMKAFFKPMKKNANGDYIMP